MEITLQPLAVDAAPAISAIKLCRRPPEVQLLASAGQQLLILASVPQPAQVMKLGGSTWDAIPLPSGAFAAAYVQAGSAVAWVMVRESTGDAAAQRLNAKTFSVYTQPQFVKSEKAGEETITAISLGEEKPKVIVFRKEEGRPTYGSGTTIGAPQQSIAAVRLLHDATGYWLFTLIDIPAVSGAPSRLTGTSEIRAGILHAQRLDLDLALSGESVQPFGRQPIYEFDVEPASNEDVAVFATTPAGALYANGPLTKTGFAPENWRETRFEHPLASPTLLIQDGVSHLAAIQSPQTPEAKILRGHLDVPIRRVGN